MSEFESRRDFGWFASERTRNLFPNIYDYRIQGYIVINELCSILFIVETSGLVLVASACCNSQHDDGSMLEAFNEIN